ncbi:uncharacterized protein AB675_11412 [Cyphellophora attinorum]|uniref:Uncharacterized protein n=1 Tax=Cyphellophora attinorum TaxID=1664694 RepID=A0A0N1H494_9EURO|nr:uncharacterized protein AB675_11412 [Phialophora attinorum]KPI39997.1 hypothetical protein AB675_11412 [Phialophora attinorum]
MQLPILNLLCLLALGLGSSATFTATIIRPDVTDLVSALPILSHPDPHDYPTLGAPLDDAAIASISAQDKSFDKEISSVMSVASASLPCKAVTDVSGSPVTICAPTQAMATMQDGAARKAVGGAVVVAALGSLLLQL